MEPSPARRSFEDALRRARSLIVESAVGNDLRRRAGPLVSEIDKLLAEHDPASALNANFTTLSDSTPPLPTELEAMRREMERLRALGEQDRDLLDAILNESPYGVIVCDVKGKLTLHNRAAERIWAGSASAEGIDDWRKYHFFHADGRPFAPEDLGMNRSLKRNETVTSEESHFQRFDGSHGMMLAGCAPIRSATGELRGAISVFVDITQYKQVEQLKDRWVALAGHEIRAPLQVLKTRLAMAASAVAQGRAVDLKNLLEILQRQVVRLESLVNDMLDASRAQAGTLAVNPSPTPMGNLLARTAEMLIQASSHHQLELDLDGEVMALADKARTEQVITNLVTNAVRYSPNGGKIRIRLRALPNETLVEVSDQGVGFEPAHAQRLFEPFLQLNLETKRDGGLGLGLYLSRELVQRMNGRIWASSEGRGKGATFAFTLPRVNV